MHYIDIWNMRSSTHESDSHCPRFMRLSWSNLLAGSTQITIVEFN